MCGILFTNDPHIDPERFRAGLELMIHRGPDVPSCHVVAGTAQLGHHRLKILDLDDRSNQPLLSRDGRSSIIYNGEIYNYRELAAQHGIPLRTTSDTELLLELYARLGAAMLGQLNGMFAFVILDNASGEFFVARDRLGVKPLYWSQRGDHSVFSSEIAAILRMQDGVRIDALGLRQYQTLRGFFNGHTLYEDVRMFPAGHYLERGRVVRYWSLPEGEREPPADDELRELIVSAVRFRMISDVPLGSYLSGGLDSTIIAALAGHVHTWTVGTPGQDEFSWARMAAEHLETEHHEVLVTADEFRATVTEMVRRRREPLCVPNEVLLRRMTQAVKSLNTVILSGEGADELLFGYDRIFRWAAGADRWDLNSFARLYAYGSEPDLEIVEDAVAPFYHRGSPLEIVAAFFQVAHLHGLLRRLDDATMACSVEARTPFVDYRLVERMSGVPFDWRMPDGVVKAPLKRIFASMIPAAIIEREKVGFPVDLQSMLPAGLVGANAMDRWFDWNLRLLELGTIEGRDNAS